MVPGLCGQFPVVVFDLFSTLFSLSFFSPIDNIIHSVNKKLHTTLLSPISSPYKI